MKSSIVSIDPEIMGGTPCFAGTRVPIQTLLDYVEAGDSIDEFLEDFPSVEHEKVIAFLEDSNRLGDLLPLVPDIVAAISSTKPGMASIVGG
jgi:uncharacterized protein (DUF433 family)